MKTPGPRKNLLHPPSSERKPSKEISGWTRCSSVAAKCCKCGGWQGFDGELFWRVVEGGTEIACRGCAEKEKQ